MFMNFAFVAHQKVYNSLFWFIISHKESISKTDKMYNLLELSLVLQQYKQLWFC